MSVTGSDKIRYSDLVGAMQTSLLSIPSNLDSYASSVPSYLQYPHVDSTVVPLTSNPTGYTYTVHWTNTEAAAVVSTADLTNDFNNFITQQLLTIPVNQKSIITSTLLVKLLTAMYCYVTARIIRVYHPKYTGEALFANLSLQPTISTLNVLDFRSLDIDGGDAEAIVNAICAQATTSVRSLSVANSYTYTHN